MKTPYPDPMANMAVAIDDDLCVIKTTDHQRLVAACVCSPSYWHLNEKIGHSLHTIHASVPSMNRKIGTPVTHFIDNAPLLQPFERCNWFVHGDNTRFHARPEALPQHAVRDWFIRSERETLCRLSEDYLLFTINPRFFPLTDLQQYPRGQPLIFTAASKTLTPMRSTILAVRKSAPLSWRG